MWSASTAVTGRLCRNETPRSPRDIGRQPAQVLLVQRPVEAVGGAQRLALLAPMPRVEQPVGGVARRQLQRGRRAG